MLCFGLTERKRKMKENANEGARRTMDAMARDYGTDKGGQYHGYAAQYERALEPLRKEGVRVVVEIGVCRAWDGNAWAADWVRAT